MGITFGDIVLFLILAACWLYACCLCVVNLIFILGGSRSTSFRLTHFFIFLGYVGLALFLIYLPKFVINHDLADSIGKILTIAIPLLVISHFVYLLIYQRRLRHQAKQDA